MKFINQTKLHSETVRGNCMAACLASILDLELSDVPQFEEILRPNNWSVELILWLLSIGYYIDAKYVHKWKDADGKEYNDLPNELCVVGGQSPRGNFLHAVIYENKQLLHDPHPSRSGILNLEDYWLIYPQKGNKAGKWYEFEYHELSDLLCDSTKN